MELRWPRRASPPNLSADEVHVWAVRLDIEDSTLKLFAELLSADERGRAERFHFEHVQRRFIASHGTLRQLLGRYLGIDPADVAFATGEGGKPRLANPPNARATPELRFNLSHSGELALVAIANGVEVGVDVERIRTVSNIERLARRYFHAAEADEVLGAEGEQRDVMFMRCWTAKEAVVKAYGSGIGAGLNVFCVPLEEAFSGFVDFSQLPQPFTKSRCWVARMTPCAGYAAACALMRAQPHARHFTYTI